MIFIGEVWLAACFGVNGEREGGLYVRLVFIINYVCFLQIQVGDSSLCYHEGTITPLVFLFSTPCGTVFLSIPILDCSLFFTRLFDEDFMGSC